MNKTESSALLAILVPIGIAAVLTVPVTMLHSSFRAYQVPTNSMDKTLMAGDHLIGQIRGMGPIHRGEIVLYRYPPDPRQVNVKRIAAVPGDRLKIINKQLYLNGKAEQEPYIQHASSFTDSYRDNFPSEPETMIFPGAQAMLRDDVVNGEVVVPPGKYFVLGDNRDLSLDSRYFGFVDGSQIFGKPLFIYLSLETPPGGSPRMRPERFLKRVD